MPITHIETDGGSLAVEVEGEGPLIICAPGMGDLRSAYQPVAAQLIRDGYTVARMDVRGHGDSSTTFKHYGDEATADDFIAIIEKLARGPAVLAGASFSAGSATMAAGRRPDLVAGVVLLGPFLRLPSIGALGLWIMPPMFWRPWGPAIWQMYAKTLWPGLDENARAERAKATRAALTKPGHWTAFQRTVAGLDHRVVGPWIEKAKNTPALVVMGEKDPDWSKPLEEAKWVASNFLDSNNVTVEGAGHAPQYERPEVVGPAMLEFLRKLQSNGAFTPS